MLRLVEMTHTSVIEIRFESSLMQNVTCDDFELFVTDFTF